MKKILFTIYIICLMIILSIACHAKPYELTIGWDANTEADLAGYKLYQKKDSSSDYSRIPVATIADANSVEHTLTVDIIETNNFVLTAFDNDNNESDHSNEISFTPDLIPPNKPGGISIKRVKVIVDIEF